MKLHTISDACGEDTCGWQACRPYERPKNISSGEDAFFEDSTEWAWAEHAAETSPHAMNEMM